MAFADNASQVHHSRVRNLPAGKIRGALARFGQRMQVARMAGVLGMLSDRELAALNLRRRDIRDYAEKLILGTT